MEIRTAAPRIPDHEVLRCIGKGSYGEVWLARAVTGTLRAVKVVRREDFELDRTFEREFEGIMKFEPISREHPGLVHVLHVGRNDEEKFYYYVMELGDDRERGSRVDPADYEPRTMGTDRAMRHRLPATECIEHGAQVAEGLAHMHECGLTHRDIKPSNIIFVNGKAKLADIGLVAAAGQMTFVGTEGFVPPEGPGTKLADIYSLGMVLYELSTGKDRLLFPELPDDLGEARSRPQWQALNEIILRACANQPKKRFPTSREMALALRAAGKKKLVRGSWFNRLVNFPLITAAIGFAIVTWRHHGAMPWPPGRFADVNTGIAPPPPLLLGRVHLESEPAGAEIYYHGERLGRTPYTCEVAPGDAAFLLKKKQYHDEWVTVPGIEAGGLKSPERVELKFFNPPIPGLVWNNGLDMVFDPQADGTHLSRRAVSADAFSKVQPLTAADIQNEVTGPNESHYIVRVPMEEAVRFCDQLTDRETLLGWLSPDLCYRPVPYIPVMPMPAQPGLSFFRLSVEKYGSITIESDPPGAQVFEGRGVESLGLTPNTFERHKPGLFEFTLRLPGFVELKVPVELKSGGQPKIMVELKQSLLAVFGKTWTNSQGQVFEPVENAPQLLICARETRVSDYAEFAKATGRKLRSNELKQTGKHPVVNVTREDAREFCRWLTEKERKSGFINAGMEYRLPTDAEWSLAAGSPNLVQEQTNPALRHMTISGYYPWASRYWPPLNAAAGTKAAGNLGDVTALRAGALNLKPDEAKALEDSFYEDGCVFTAPVGSFEPKIPESKSGEGKAGAGEFRNGENRTGEPKSAESKTGGLFDLSGNVWEFVEDDFGENPAIVGPGQLDRASYAVLRGGAWDTPATDIVQLAAQYRRTLPPDKFDASSGFRVILSPVPGEEPEPPPPVPVTPSSAYPIPFTVPPFSQPSNPLLPGNPVSPLQPPATPGSNSNSNSNPGSHPPRELPHSSAPAPAQTNPGPNSNPNPNPAPPSFTSPTAEPPL